MSQPQTLLIDANVLLRYLLGDDPELSAKADAWLEPAHFRQVAPKRHE